jgi:hypothetical protein
MKEKAMKKSQKKLIPLIFNKEECNTTTRSVIEYDLSSEKR